MKKHQATTNENDLIKQYQGLIRDIAKRFNPPNETEMEEYIQEGNIAMLKASRRFNINLGYKLSTLAWIYIIRAIGRYIALKKQKDWIELLGNRDIAIEPSETKLWEILPNLSSDEMKMLDMKLDGYSLEDIGKEFGHTKTWASKEFSKLTHKIKIANK